MKVQEAIRLRILELVKERNISINLLATNSFMTTSTIASILNGHSKKSEAKTISRICYGLGISVREFFDSALFDDNKSDVEDL